jgi:ankyrin repeat protein
MTPLHQAAAIGSRPCIRALVNSGKCDYLLQDELGRYAFEVALESTKDSGIVRLLQKKQVQQAFLQGVPALSARIPKRN